MKRKIIVCINKEEVAAFQDYVRNKMTVLVEIMQADKNILQSVRELIRSLKLEYDNMGLFKNNGAADIEEIVQTITDIKGIAWRKFLEGKEILDAKDYNTIVEDTIRSHLFQEGHLHDKIDEQILGPETEETKAKIMQRCMSLFSNVVKAHEVNLAVAMDLKELSTLIKDPKVFSRIAQAAIPPLMACYMPRIDKFIAQRQAEIEAKHDKISQ